MPQEKKSLDKERMDRVVASARSFSKGRERGYRERSLKLFPWICGRCSREFDEKNVKQLTVHHKDHNHDNNPNDGSNWELLCIYCHDNEHERLVEQERYGGSSPDDEQADNLTHRPFAGLADLLKEKK